MKFPQSVMIWGAVTSAGVGPLCFIMSKINAGDYQETLEHSKLVSRWKHNGDADFFYSRTLVSAHSDKTLPSGLLNMILLCLIGQLTCLKGGKLTSYSVAGCSHNLMH